MKANSFFELILKIKSKIEEDVEDKGVFRSFCLDVAYMQSLEQTGKDYEFYFLFSEYTTIINNWFENAVMFKNKGFSGVYSISKKEGVYSFIWLNDKLEENNND